MPSLVLKPVDLSIVFASKFVLHFMQPKNWNVLLSHYIYMYYREITRVESSSFTLNDCFIWFRYSEI